MRTGSTFCTVRLKSTTTMMHWKKTFFNRWLLGSIDQLLITLFPLLNIMVYGYHFCFKIIMSHVLGIYLYTQNACPTGELSASSHIRCNNYFRCECLWFLFTFTTFRAPLAATWQKSSMLFVSCELRAGALLSTKSFVWLLIMPFGFAT